MSPEACREREIAECSIPSCSGDDGVPLLGRPGSEGAECAAGDEMALQIEGVVDGGIRGEEALCGSA